MRVQVVSIETDWDMHLKTSLRESYKAAHLKHGQCLVAFNGFRTMARVIDYEGGVHDYYTPRNNPFDIDALAIRMRNGLGVIIELGVKGKAAEDQAHVKQGAKKAPTRKRKVA